MEQTPAQVMLLGAVLPALIAGAAALLGWGLLSDDETPAARRPWWIAPPALFLAFVCVLGATEAIPGELWPRSAIDRKLAIGLMALGAGLVSALAPWRVGGALAAALGAGAAAWVSAGALHPQTIGTGELVGMLAIAGGVGGAAVWVYDRWDAEGRWLAPMGLAMVAGGGVGVIFLGSLNETALHAGLLGSFLAAWGLARLVVPRASLARGGAATFAVLMAGLLTMGRSLGLPPAPGLSYVLVLVAIGAVGVGAQLGRGRGWFVRMIVMVAVTGAPLGAAIGIALAADQRAADEDGSDDDTDWSDYYENYSPDG